jgi:hypothetical protein
MNKLLAAGLAFAGCCGIAHASGFNADRSAMTFDALDMVRIAAQDTANDAKHERYRFAIGHDVKINPSAHGVWTTHADGSTSWVFDIGTPDAAHLNFGFNQFRLPAGARLTISSPGGVGEKLVYTDANNAPGGQLWTAVLQGANARLRLEVPAGKAGDVQLELVRIGHGYRGFGSQAKHCKSGACNMDVACLGPADPWNEPRRSVGAYTTGGVDTCTGSLVNNTANDRRMLFATAAHCEITDDDTAATVVVYWNYESPTCRAPGSTASGQVVPRPTTTTSGGRFLASTLNPFTGSTDVLRSDFTLLELNGPPNPAWNLFWSGWDRRDAASHACAAPSDPASTSGLCASIHHPGVDEKRITFVEANMDKVSYQSGIDSHYHPFWDPTPPILPGIQPPPASVVPNVTEGGSSGSPLYDAQRRLVGVLSGGPSACGATGASLSDYYGRLASAWEGGGTVATAMKTHLDPAGNGTAQFIDGIGMCTQPAAPTGIAASATGANQITVTWTAAAGLTKYRILRADGACPGGNYAQIAEVDNVTSYVDAAVSGGSTYSYQVKSVSSEPCESLAGTCSSATATGQCTLAPTFAGITSAASAGTGQCGVNLAWSAATGRCGAGSQVKYNVFRSATPNFTPSAANAIATCATGTSHTDATAASGTTWHYIVRAEDTGASGPGTCQSGIEDANTVAQSASPTGPAIADFSDDAEAGMTNWSATGTGAGANWAQVTTEAHSPTRSWYVPDPTTASDRMLALAAPRTVPDLAGVTLEAWLRYNTETNYDGAQLEYSLDGTTWTNILAAQGTVPANANRFLEGGYAGAMSSSSGFGANPAWHGARTTWTRSVVDLADFRGRSANFRFRFKSDSSETASGTPGFWVDDVKISYGSACTVGEGIFGNGFEP